MEYFKATGQKNEHYRTHKHTTENEGTPSRTASLSDKRPQNTERLRSNGQRRRSQRPSVRLGAAARSVKSRWSGGCISLFVCSATFSAVRAASQSDLESPFCMSQPIRRLASHPDVASFFSMGLEQCSAQVRSSAAISLVCSLLTLFVLGQAASYGKCVVDKVDNLQQGACTQQWEALAACLKTSVRPSFPSSLTFSAHSMLTVMLF